MATIRNPASSISFVIAPELDAFTASGFIIVNVRFPAILEVCSFGCLKNVPVSFQDGRKNNT
jgi:hypothetical protein